MQYILLKNVARLVLTQNFISIFYCHQEGFEAKEVEGFFSFLATVLDLNL